MGVLLTSRQLADRERFVDEDLCRTGVLLLDALRERTLGAEVIFESLARVFLVKLVRDYTDRPDEAAAAGEGLTGAPATGPCSISSRRATAGRSPSRTSRTRRTWPRRASRASSRRPSA